MKQIKSFMYVLALAVILAGAAGITKAQASGVATPTYKLTWNVPANCSVKVYASQTEMTSGTSFAEGTEIEVACTAPSGFVIEVTSSDVELTKFGQGYSFSMPANTVNLTVSMGPEVQNPSQGTGTLVAKANYNNETITVTSDKQVYYQVVKSEEPGTLKPANWIKAAYDTTNKEYCIDFSSVANGKDAYFALTTDNEAVKATEVAVVDSVIKSVKVGLNYRTEEIEEGLADVIASLNVKGVDGSDDNEDGTAAEYSLKWKRGANGKWTQADDFDQLQWDMLKASNGTLYVAIDGKVKATQGEKTEVEYFRLSKEAKVKIPKSAKAPTVKVDYGKGTIALKNGMQISVNGKKWLTVSLYDKNETAREQKFHNDPTVVTKVKISVVTPRELVDAVNTNNLDACQYGSNVDLSLMVRTAATDKKFPSASTTIKFKTPSARPDATTAAANGHYPISYTVADKTAGVAAEMIIDVAKLIVIDENKGEDFSAYEYILLDNAVDATEVDLLKVKWSSIPADGRVDLSGQIGKTYKYTKTDKSSVTVKYEASTFIVLRRKADIDNELFAGGYREIGIQFSPAAGEDK